MIIELFGPPGVGKTTLARALEARLHERGHDVKLLLSYRPSEGPRGSHAGGLARRRIPAAVHRLARPMVEILAAARHSADSFEARAAMDLTRLLVPRNVIHSLRLRQYLLRLSRIWHDASLAGDIVLVDQGFVQAVYTCALLARAADPERCRRALCGVPEADLLVRLDAPLEILEARLADRRRRQGRIEQLLDLWTTLGSVSIFDQLHSLLRARGRPVISVDSTDQRSLREGVDELEQIMAHVQRNLGIQCNVLAGFDAEQRDRG